jgi:hypothetical protein
MSLLSEDLLPNIAIHLGQIAVTINGCPPLLSILHKEHANFSIALPKNSETMTTNPSNLAHIPSQIKTHLERLGLKAPTLPEPVINSYTDLPRVYFTLESINAYVAIFFPINFYTSST